MLSINEVEYNCMRNLDLILPNSLSPLVHLKIRLNNCPFPLFFQPDEKILKERGILFQSYVKIELSLTLPVVSNS